MNFKYLVKLCENASATGHAAAPPAIYILPTGFHGSLKAAFYTIYHDVPLPALSQVDTDVISKWRTLEKQADDSSKIPKDPTRKPTAEERERIFICKSAVNKLDRFLGQILLKVPVVYTVSPQTPTMAVDAKDNLYINLYFADTLSDHEVMGVLAHEALHIYLKHHMRAKDYGISKQQDFRWANIAMDSLINDMLLSSGFTLPGGCIHATTRDMYDPATYAKKQIKSLTITMLYVEHNIPDFNIAKPRLFRKNIDISIRNWEAVFTAIKELIDALPQINDPNKGKNNPFGDLEEDFQPGDIVYDKQSKKYGKIITIDEKTGAVELTELSEQQAKAMAPKL